MISISHPGAVQWFLDLVLEELLDFSLARLTGRVVRP